MKDKVKKRISFIFLFSLLFFISGCNSGENKNISTSLSETSVSISCSEESTEDIRETTKEQKWGPSYISPELYEELHKGKIKYTVYSKAQVDLDFYLPVEITKYVDPDTMTYDLYQVFEDYGWQEGDGYYYYVIDDLMVKLAYSTLDDSDTQLITYYFAYKDDPDENYYRYFGGQTTDNVYFYMYSNSEPNYYIRTSDDLYVTYDECIVLTYIISWVSVRPYTNPFLFARLPHDEGMPDYDKYYFYFD